MPEVGGAPTAASGQGAAEGLPALASPPRPLLPQGAGEGREEEGGGSALLLSLPAGGKGRHAPRPQGCSRPRLPSKRGSRLSSGNSMAGTGARRAAAFPAPHMPGAGVRSAAAGGARPAPTWAAPGAGPAFMAAL